LTYSIMCILMLVSWQDCSFRTNSRNNLENCLLSKWGYHPL